MKKKSTFESEWDSRSISVSTKNDWDEYKEYLKEEGKCGVYREGNSLEIYNEDEDSSDGMVVLKIKEKDLY